MKFQCITTPDAMLVHVGGPFLGQRHDARMLNESRIRPYLLAHARGPDGQQMSVYGDEGYGQSPEVKAPFRGNMLTPEPHQRNESMQHSRLSAEWAFGYISNNFGIINYFQKLRVGLSPIALYFPIAALFSNVLCCYGRNSTTKTFFQMEPPTVEEYLTPRGVWNKTRVIHEEPDYFNIIA